MNNGMHLIKRFIRKTRQNIKRSKQHKNTDVFILSYPKCGRTWLRMMIGKYVNDFYNLNISIDQLTEIYHYTSIRSDIPTIDLIHDGFPHLKYLKQIKIDKTSFKDKKVIFLVRDPRDVVVSYYHQFMYRGDKLESVNPNYEGDIHDFLYNGVGSLKNIIKYYNIWAKEKEKPLDFLLVKYEDLKNDTKNVLANILKFLSVKVNPDLIEQAVVFCNFENMKRMENEGILNKGRFGSKDDNKGVKTRKGEVGGYSKYFNNDDLAYIEKCINELDDSYESYKIKLSKKVVE